MRVGNISTSELVKSTWCGHVCRLSLAPVTWPGPRPIRKRSRTEMRHRMFYIFIEDHCFISFTFYPGDSRVGRENSRNGGNIVLRCIVLSGLTQHCALPSYQSEENINEIFHDSLFRGAQDHFSIYYMLKYIHIQTGTYIYMTFCNNFSTVHYFILV